MFVRRKKLNLLLTKCIIETARNCGRNLSIKQKNQILLKVSKEVEKPKKCIKKVK